MTTQLCFKSLYELYKCSLHTHLPKDIPVVDSHCHLDEFFNNDVFIKPLSSSNIRQIYVVSNKHRYQNWNQFRHIACKNLYIYESFGIHPKYLPEVDLNSKIMQLKSIVSRKENPVTGRPIVGIGETGFDEISRFSIMDQKLALESQITTARQTGLPLILHCRGHSLFRPLFDCVSSLLPSNHRIQWHCIKSDSDLRVIDNFIALYPNSVISINGGATLINDIDQDKEFKKWIRNHPKILDHLVLETDCPWLCPRGLTIQEYNPCTGIFVTSKWVENVLRASGKNISKIIQIANNNAQKIFQF